MKANLFIMLAACALIQFAGAEANSGSAVAQKRADGATSVSVNRELARQFYVPFATGNAALLNNLLAPNWEDIPLAPNQKPGRDGLIPIIQQLRGTFSKFSIVSQDFIAEGDKVAVRTVWTGTHTGDFFGIKGTGKTIMLNTTDIHQIANGKIIRTWHLEDMMGVYGQLGGLSGKQ